MLGAPSSAAAELSLGPSVEPLCLEQKCMVQSNCCYRQVLLDLDPCHRQASRTQPQEALPDCWGLMLILSQVTTNLWKEILPLVATVQPIMSTERLAMGTPLC